ncbi:type II toxin-antitoxin system RelB/DinJ family antitoxin [Salmonella enterica]
MPTVNVNVRIDAELKQYADAAMQLAGATPTQAITLLYQYIAENKRLPFVVSTSVKTTEDVVEETTELLSRALSVVLDLRAWMQQDKLQGKELMAYYHRLDDLLKYAKEKAYYLEDRRDLSITINNLNKILTALVDFIDFGYGYAQIRLLPSEKSNFSEAVDDLKRSISKLVQNGAPKE